MIEQVFTVIVALLFLLVGYYLGYTTKQTKLSLREENKPKKKNPLIRAAVKAGIIEYPTQEDVDYVESGEEKVDEAREKVFRENFKL